MKTLKNGLLGLLGVVLTFIPMMYGCENSGTQLTTSATGSADGKISATAPVQKKTTLKFFTYEDVMKEKHDLINAEFTKRNPDITIEMVYVNYPDYNTMVDTAIFAGEDLDICFFNIAQDYIVRAAKGQFLSLDNYLKEEGYSKVTDLYTIDSTFNGRVYGLPGDTKSFIVYINKNDLDKAGLPIPPAYWTWDDYKSYAKQLTWGAGKDKHYGSMFYTWPHYYLFDLYNTYDGCPFFKPDGSFNFDNPGYTRFLQTRLEMEQIDKSQIPVIEVKAMNIDYRSAFFSGRVSMLPCLTNMLPEVASDNYPHDFVTTFAMLPKPVGVGRDGVTYEDNRFYSIGKSSKNPDEAYKFIRFFTTEGIQMKDVAFTADKKNPQLNQAIEKAISNKPYLYDMLQLKKVLLDPKYKTNTWENIPVYTYEIDKMVGAEFDKVLVGGETIDVAVENLKIQGEAIIAKYKKQ